MSFLSKQIHFFVNKLFCLNVDKVLLLMVLWGIACCVSATQNASFRFKTLESEDFALAGAVTTIVQDDLGFIWIGGENGLLRFDGYNTILYRVERNNPRSISDSYIRESLLDSKGRLWIATNRGLNRYDYGIEGFVHYLHDEKNTNSLGHNEVTGLAEDSQGNIWVSTGASLDKFNPETNTFVHYPLNIFDDNGRQANKLSSIIVTKEGKIWASTWGGGAYFLDPETEQFTQYPHDPSNPKSINHASVWRVFEDSYGAIWFATQGGLDRFNPSIQGFDHFTHDPTNERSLAYNMVSDIIEDTKGNLWVATDGGGLHLFDRKNERFFRYNDSNKVQYGLSNNKIRNVFSDRTGGLWIGHFPSGISVLDRYASAFVNYSDGVGKNGLSHKAVLAIAQDKAGILWLGTEKGVNRLDRKNNSITHFLHAPNKPKNVKESDYLLADPVISILVDSHGYVWAGTWTGSVSRLDPNTGIFRHYSEKEPGGVNRDQVWALFEDSNGVVWAGCSDGGLNKYDREKDVFVSYNIAKHDAAPGRITAIYEDSKRNFWLGMDTGLHLYNRDDGTYISYRNDDADENSLSAEGVSVIMEDSRGQLWAATRGGGVNRFNSEKQNFAVFNKQRGLADDTVNGIVEDKQGNIWFSTGDGISKFDPQKESFQTFREQHGISGNLHNRPAYFQTDAGEIAFGSAKGLTIFKPENIEYNLDPPPVVLTDFRLFNKPVVAGDKNNLLDRSISTSDKLILSHNHYVFSFAFTALNYRIPEMNQYAYMLEGFDKDWVYVGSKRTATYTNLDPGNYNFRVKASNNEGVWNEEGMKLSINVLPPWWQTWWAYTIYALMILGSIWRAIDIQRRKRKMVEEQNKILETKVAERTKELAAKNNDIQAMLGNMQQGLFTVEEGGTVHPEYSRYLEAIFETRDIVGKPAKDLLFENASLGADERDQVDTGIGMLIGEDEMMFDFNSHTLITEFEANIGGSKKYLTLDWNPILVDDVIEKLMVTVRDVTLLRQIEAEAAAKKAELDIISQLLNVPAKKYKQFIQSACQYLAECRSTVENTTVRDEDAIALMFRNMHTVKGNSRTLSFKNVSDIAHEVEAYYTGLKENSEQVWDQETLKKDLCRVEAAIDQYESVYNDVLGRSDDAEPSRGAGIWLDKSSIERYKADIKPLGNTIPKSVRHLFTCAMTKTLEEVFADILEALPSIAKQLDKPTPNVNFSTKGVRITESAQDLLNDVFVHMFRNSMDHGIEAPEERASQGKDETGNIYISAKENGGKLHLSIRDDGKGIDLDRLYKKGREQKVWAEDHQPSKDEIADLIFYSGVSTKENVSDISGRGVGMDAVKQFIIQHKGNIALALLDDKDNGFVGFETKIELPASAFILVDNELLDS